MTIYGTKIEYDYLYNAAGVATLREMTGQSGSHVRDEVDFRFSLHIYRHQDVLIGYTKMWSGNYLKKQVPVISSDLFYVQCNIRF